MKRILAAITTIVIAIGLAVTGVSTANADDAVTPSVSKTAVATTPTPLTLASTDPSPAPTPAIAPSGLPNLSASPNPSASPVARTTAPLSVTPPSPQSSTSQKPLAGSTPSGEKCLPASAVSYSYDPMKNSGAVVVSAQPYSTAVLCSPIYITAASWKYTRAATWPQVLDSVETNYFTVSKAGRTEFRAGVTCGQGDIYARTGSYIVPTQSLQGPQGWEKFLSGLASPINPVNTLKENPPTYMQSPISCVHVLPAASVIAGQCYWDVKQGASTKSVTIRYDNRESNVPVDFSVQGNLEQKVDYSAYNRAVAGGAIVEITPPASSTGGASYTVLAAGMKMSLSVPPYDACPPTIPTLPLTDPTPVTFVDTCGIQGDKVVIPSLTAEDHFTYSTTDGQVNGARTVTVTAIPGAGYGFSSDATTSWSHTFKTDVENHCVNVPGDPEAVNEICASSPGGVVGGYLTVVPVAGVVYTIHRVRPTGADIAVTAPKTIVEPGDYAITAAAKPGFTLSGNLEWKLTVANKAVNCALPTDAFLPSSVNWVSQTCSAGRTVSGYIAIDPTDFLSYFVGTTQLVSARTAFAPGTYEVRVVAPPGDTIDGPSRYTATIATPRTSCGNLQSQSLRTLAFTGFDSGAGYLVVAFGLLMLGAVLVFTARRRAKA